MPPGFEHLAHRGVPAHRHAGVAWIGAGRLCALQGIRQRRSERAPGVDELRPREIEENEGRAFSLFRHLRASPVKGFQIGAVEQLRGSKGLEYCERRLDFSIDCGAERSRRFVHASIEDLAALIQRLQHDDAGEDEQRQRRHEYQDEKMRPEPHRCSPTPCE